MLVASQVKRYRSERRLSAQQLAEACTALGVPLQRSVVANFENGRRNTVTVAELMALAKVLNVPPIMLIFPIGQEESVEALPSGHVAPWEAAKWFTGEQPFPGEQDDQNWISAATPVVMYREHDRRVEDWRWERGRLAHVSDRADRASIEATVRKLEQRIAEARQTMRQAGVTPPSLPEGLAHLDTVG